MVLLTGFEPFGLHRVNPSELIVEQLAVEVGATAILPVSPLQAPAMLETAIQLHRPDVVLSLGLAVGRATLGLETVAVNILNCDIHSNPGLEGEDRPVLASGPPAYFATVPLHAIVTAWQATNVPGELSDSAGVFICNQVFYWSLRWGGSYGYRAGFIHVPYMPGQGEPNLPLSVMVDGVRLALEACSGTHAKGQR